MACVACGTPASARASFCGSCGQPLPARPTCGSCAALLAPDALFCHRCGLRCMEAREAAAYETAETVRLRDPGSLSPGETHVGDTVETRAMAEPRELQPDSAATTVAAKPTQIEEAVTVAIDRSHPRSDNEHNCTSCKVAIVPGGRFCRSCGAEI